MTIASQALSAWTATRADDTRTGSNHFFQAALIPSIFVAETRQNVRIPTEDLELTLNNILQDSQLASYKKSWKWASEFVR